MAKFRPDSNSCTVVLESNKLAFAYKSKKSLTFERFGSGDFLATWKQYSQQR